MKNIILACTLLFSVLSSASGRLPNTYHFEQVELESLSNLYEYKFEREYPYPSSFHGFLLDLNGDKNPEYLVKLNVGERCKSCWFILDGVAGEEIAYFNGLVEIVGNSSSVNGFPVFEVYYQKEKELKVYAFSGRKYELVSCVLVGKNGAPISCNSIGGNRVPVQMLNKLSQQDLRSGASFSGGRYATAKTNASTSAFAAGRYA